MRQLILAAAALSLLAAPAFAASKKAETNTATPKAERHYDCSKKGNANKAECKAAATAATPATPAKPATPATPAVKPATPATPAKAAKAATPASKSDTATGKTRSTAQLANDNKMKACGQQWDKMSEAQKADWKTKGEKFKDKNGKAYTGWIAFSVECRKK